MSFNNKIKITKPSEKKIKKDILKNLYVLLNAFHSKIFPRKIEGTGFSDKVSDHFNLLILTPQQMLQRLAIALAQVKTGITS